MGLGVESSNRGGTVNVLIDNLGVSGELEGRLVVQDALDTLDSEACVDDVIPVEMGTHVMVESLNQRCM